MGDVADDLFDEALMQEAESSNVDVRETINKMESDYIYGELKWKSISGPILVRDMTTDHIKNTIPFIERGGVNLDEPIMESWIRIFKLELEKRGV